MSGWVWFILGALWVCVMLPLGFWIVTRERGIDRMSDEWLERKRRESRWNG